MRLSGLILATAVALVSFVIPRPSQAQLYVSLSAPPPLQMDVQPQLSTPNAIWTPGYWARGPSGYYWVAGSWTQPPQQGYLWTPGYWGYSQNQYSYNQGYWGPQVGYYGGINYGNGYYGNGYSGGMWQGNAFRYNTAVSRVNRYVIRNVYVNRRVIVRYVNRTSYNGGRGGIRMHPDSRQIAYARQRHIYATPLQRRRMIEASRDRHNFYVNHRSQPMHANAHAMYHMNNGHPPKATVPVVRARAAAAGQRQEKNSKHKPPA
jgi:hypothetical protein